MAPVLVMLRTWELAGAEEQHALTVVRALLGGVEQCFGGSGVRDPHWPTLFDCHVAEGFKPAIARSANSLLERVSIESRRSNAARKADIDKQRRLETTRSLDRVNRLKQLLCGTPPAPVAPGEEREWFQLSSGFARQARPMLRSPGQEMLAADQVDGRISAGPATFSRSTTLTLPLPNVPGIHRETQTRALRQPGPDRHWPCRMDRLAHSSDGASVVRRDSEFYAADDYQEESQRALMVRPRRCCRTHLSPGARRPTA